MSDTPSSVSPNRPSQLGRWAQDTFSRESIFAGIKTLAWLAPLTLLIWVYAERSQVVSSPAPGETIPIEVRSSDPNHFYVKLMMAENDQSVIAQLRGPQARIEQVIKNIAPQDNSPSVILTIDASAAGVRELDAAKELSQNQIFTNAAVSVFNCKPVTLKVFIDDIIEDEADVVVKSDQRIQVASAVFTPAKVKIRGPSKDINDAKAQGPLIVYADFDKNVLQQAGSHEDVAVRIQSEQFAGKPVTLLSNTVKATIEVRQSESSREIKAVPILVLGPIELINNYKVQIPDRVLPTVKIIGPENIVDQIDKGSSDLRVIAILRISNKDVTTEKNSAIPEIRLPDPSVRLDPTYTPRELTYTLVKRDQP